MTARRDRQDNKATLKRLISDLFHHVRASRVTLRQRKSDLDEGFPVIAEVAGVGVMRLMQQGEVDLSDDPVFNWLKGGGEMVVVDDCTRSTASGQAFTIVAQYGIKAEIVAPIRVDSRLTAIISVHETGGPRKWSSDEVTAVLRTTNEIARLLSV